MATRSKGHKRRAGPQSIYSLEDAKEWLKLNPDAARVKVKIYSLEMPRDELQAIAEWMELHEIPSIGTALRMLTSAALSVAPAWTVYNLKRRYWSRMVKKRITDDVVRFLQNSQDEIDTELAQEMSQPPPEALQYVDGGAHENQE